MIIDRQIQMLSDQVVANLRNLGLPPLWQDRILLGAQHLAEHRAPNSVIAVPKRLRYGLPEVATNAGIPRKAARPIALKAVQYAMHVWGQAMPAQPEKPHETVTDIGMAEAIEEVIILSAWQLCGTRAMLLDGTLDLTGTTQTGYNIVFGLELQGAITDTQVNPIRQVRPDLSLISVPLMTSINFTQPGGN